MYFRMDLSPTRPVPGGQGGVGKEEASYVDMNCAPQGHTRSVTVDSGMSQISLLTPDLDILHIDDPPLMEPVSAAMDIPRGVCSNNTNPSLPRTDSCSSLPNGSYLSVESLPLDCNSFKKPFDPCLPSSPFSSPCSMRASASSSCLESKSPTDSNQISSVATSIPKILRNSFSKLLTRATSISGRSKSPESNKSSIDDEGEEKKWSESSEDIEEIVSDSVQKGLPIIPFAYPTFSVVNKKLEETKDIIRKNSAKDLKRAFNENKMKNHDIYKEEEEEGSKEDKSLYSVVSTAKREMEKSSHTASSYVEMSLSTGFPGGKDSIKKTTAGSLDESYMAMASRTTRSVSIEEEPYMKMSDDAYMSMKQPPVRSMSTDAYMSMHTHTLPKKHRRRTSHEPMFQMEDNSVSSFRGPRSPEKISSCIYSENTFPRRKKKMSIFNRTSDEDGERNNQILQGAFVKQFRKGNKHRDDYVYVDFEKQNYMDMAQSGDKFSNKWKFLNFSSGGSGK